MTVVIDRTRATTAQLDTVLCKSLIPILQKHYPDSLARMVIFPNTGTYFWMAWKLAGTMIDPLTMQKVCI